MKKLVAAQMKTDRGDVRMENGLIRFVRQNDEEEIQSVAEPRGWNMTGQPCGGRIGLNLAAFLRKGAELFVKLWFSE